MSESVHQQALKDMKSQRVQSQGFTPIRFLPGRNLFNKGQGEYTDVLIKCGDKEWKAHSCVLKSACAFFKGCLDSSCKEAESKVIVLVDDEPAVCEIFLEFLYTGYLRSPDGSWIVSLQSQPEYDPPGDESGDTPEVPDEKRNFVFPGLYTQMLIDLCRMSDKYMVPELMEAISDVFVSDPGIGGQYDVLVPIYSAIKDLGESAQLLFFQEILKRNITRATMGEFQFSKPCKEFLRENPDVATELFIEQQDLIERMHQHIKGVDKRCYQACRCGDCTDYSKMGRLQSCCGRCGSPFVHAVPPSWCSTNTQYDYCSNCHGMYAEELAAHW